MPALLHNIPDTPLEALHLQHYEVSPTEPLHDIKGHLTNVIDELRAVVTGNVKEKLSNIYASVLGKETLRCCDYRKAAILILLALEELHGDRQLIELLRTIVEITEILYSDDSKRTSQAVLRLHNLAFIHGKVCTELFHTPKTMTRRKMFGRYFHSITSHAAILYRIVSLRSMNAETQERMFGQCKSITKATSSQRPNHIITNILLRLQEEAKANPSNVKCLEAQEGEITKLAKAVSLKQNTIIPKQWLQQSPRQYQGHLERISDFLVTGPGKWWREVDNGIEFFDVSLPSPSLPPHQMFHYRSTNLTDIDVYLLSKWEECLDNEIPLPAVYIRTYTPAGSLHSILTENTTEDIQSPGDTEFHPAEIMELQTTDPRKQLQTTHLDQPSRPNVTGLQPEPATHLTGNSHSLNDHHSTLPACTTNSVHHNANPTANTNSTESPSPKIGTSLQNSQAKSIAKILPNDDEVKLFDQLRTKIKVTKKKHRPLPPTLCTQYDKVSCSIKNKLVNVYKANVHVLAKWESEFRSTHGGSPTIAKQDYPLGLRTALHMKNLAQQVLLHEWKMEI